MTVGSKVKQTLSSLKGVKSTLEIYAAQSRDEEAAAIYREAAGIIDGVAQNLRERVQALEFEEPQYKGL